MSSDGGKGAESSDWSEDIRRYEMTLSYVSGDSTGPTEKDCDSSPQATPFGTEVRQL